MRLILLRPSHANFDFLFSNFAVRDFNLFTLDFNTQPEMRINRKLKFVLMRSAFCRGVSRGMLYYYTVDYCHVISFFESL